MIDVDDYPTFETLLCCGDGFRNKCGVYTIISPSGKNYVGMTSRSFYTRWKQHRSLLLRGKHHCVGLQRAFLKYGAGGITLKTVFSFPVGKVSVKYLGAKEIETWDLLNSSGVPLYNCRPSENDYVIYGPEASARRRVSSTGARRRKWGILSTTQQVCSGCGVKFMNKQRRKYCSHDCFIKHRSKEQEERIQKMITGHLIDSDV